ncbi:MAG: hypothetical protein MR451_01985 [Clostridiales bacterium]|nr:hypothetical protein [Clostridiales bacterium]
MCKQYTGPWRLAHRGVCQDAPENTMEAFEQAYRDGVEGLEIDIRMTRDGEIVVHHDETFARLTAGSAAPCEKRIQDCTWEEAAALRVPYANHLLDNWHPDGMPDETRAIDVQRQMGLDPAHPMMDALRADSRCAHLIRLQTLLDWMDGLDRRLILEIEYKAPGMMPELCRLLEDCAKRMDCIIFSGDPTLIDEIQDYAAAHTLPEGVKLGANIRRLTDAWKEKIPSMRLFEVGLNADALAPDDIAWLHDHQILVFSNLGDYPAAWQDICSNGLTGFKTNYAASFTAWWFDWQKNKA